jgi:hypothetical protein
MDEPILQFTKVISPDVFYKEIDRLVKKHKLDYVDAIVHFCNANEIEIEAAASMIRSNLRIKSAIQTEGEALHYLPKTAKLPI